MSGARAEKFVIFNLRLLAASFAVTGLLFLIVPDGTLGVLDDFGDIFGTFTQAPDTDVKLWLALGFSYMTVITGLCAVAATDPVRHRPMLLVLAMGKAASSLTALGFYIWDADVFAYLLNFLVDGYLVFAALWLHSLTGRIGGPAAPV